MTHPRDLQNQAFHTPFGRGVLNPRAAQLRLCDGLRTDVILRHIVARSRQHEALRDEVGEDPFGVLLGGVAEGVERDLGVERRLVRVVDAREVLDLPLARAPVHALHVAPLTLLERRVNEDLYEEVCPDQEAAFVAGRAVRADGGADDRPAVPYYLRSDEADATDVRVAVFLAEA